MVNGNQNEPDCPSDESGGRDQLPAGNSPFDRRSFIKAAGAAAAVPIVASGTGAAQTTHHLEVLTTEDPSELSYEFTATGKIERDRDNGDNSAGDNDDVVQNDDGTWTANGYTGNGYGDAYYFEGQITEFAPESGPYELYLDGELVSLDELVDTGPDYDHIVEVLTTEDPSELSYELTTSGEIAKYTDNGDNSAGDNDDVVENDDGTWTANGYTGNGHGDAYYFDGEIESFGPVEDFVEIRVDGQPIDLSQFEEGPDYDHLIEVLTTEDPSELSYEFTTTGEIQPYFENGDNSAEDNDNVVENDDGTWTLSGYTGNGYGDAFHFDGNLESFGPVVDFVEVRVDGEPIDLSQFEEGPDYDHVVEVLTTEDPSELSYELTASGEIAKHTDNGDDSAGDNDDVVENDDGTWTANGYTGNGFGDTYYFDGEIESYGPVEDFVEVRVDGEPIDLEPFDDGPDYDHLIEVLTTEDPSEISYRFKTTGEVEAYFENGDNSAENNDSVRQNGDGTWSVSGYTGNGFGDSFHYDGELESFGPVRSFVEVRVDGSEIDLSEYESEDSGPLIGGGEGYEDTVPESEADVVVSTHSELESALDSASRGDVVYVDPDATIDVGDAEMTIPSGITLASDRGIDGAPGGHIRTDTFDTWPGMFTVESDVRVTGVRISGPLQTYKEYHKPLASGLTVEGSNCEIDNVEMFGFNHAAIKLRSGGYVHHSHIHHNPMDGLGYGIMCLGGQDILVEYNYFNYNRHSVANEGTAGYEVRYNHFGPEAVSYQVGTHRPGGTTLKIHHNTFEPVENIATDAEYENHISIRGTPDDIAEIHNNWFYNWVEPLDSPNGWSKEAIIQVHVDEWSNVDFFDNHYGSDQPSSDDIGCP